MTTNTEWCVLFWDGTRWQRGPVVYDNERDARTAALAIRFAPAMAFPCDAEPPADPPSFDIRFSC